MNKASGRAVVNDSPADCQSREVHEVKFSAENLARPLVQSSPCTQIKKGHRKVSFFDFCAEFDFESDAFSGL